MGKPKGRTNRHKLKVFTPYDKIIAQRLKGRVNLPPINPDDQEVPAEFRRIFNKVETSNTDYVPPKRTKRKDDAVEIDGFRQRAWETMDSFLKRVNRETREAIDEEVMKISYGLDTKKASPSDDNGEDIGNSRDERNQSRNRSRKGQKSKAENSGKKRTAEREDHEKPSKRKANDSDEPVNKKRKKKNSSKQEFDPLNVREHIRFGERADHPPRLVAQPKSAKSARTPGRRDLLLKNFMSKPVADETIKCDDPVKQNVLEQERQRVIDAYRQQKKLNRLKESQ